MSRSFIWSVTLVLVLLAAVGLAPPAAGALLHRPAVLSAPAPEVGSESWAAARGALREQADLASAALAPEDLPDLCPPAVWTDLPPSGVAPDQVHLAFFECQPPDQRLSPYLAGLAIAEQGVGGADGRGDREMMLAYLIAFTPQSSTGFRITDHQFDGPLVGRQTAWAAGLRLGRPVMEAYWVTFRSGGWVAALDTAGLSQEETADLAGLVAGRLERLTAIP